MPRLWVYNYDFEFRLAGLPQQTVGDKGPFGLLNRASAWLLPLLKPGDALLVLQEPQPWLQEQWQNALGFLPRWLVSRPQPETNAPLAWPRPAGDWQIQAFGQSHAPLQAPLAGWDLNSKLTAHRLRQEHLPPGWQLPSALVEPSQDLVERISWFSHLVGPVLLKHPFGTSGKLTQDCSSHPTPSQLKPYQAWLKQGGSLLLEQRQDFAQEASLQVVLEEEGPQLLAWCGLLNDRLGSYKASLVGPRPLPERLVKDLLPLLQAIHQAGFRGHLGLDLAQERRGHWRLLEINARLTMGWLAQRWAELLAPGKACLFWTFFLESPHPLAPSDLAASLRVNLGSDAQDLHLVDLACQRSPKGARHLLTLLLVEPSQKFCSELQQEPKPRLVKGLVHI